MLTTFTLYITQSVQTSLEVWVGTNLGKKQSLVYDFNNNCIIERLLTNVNKKSYKYTFKQKMPSISTCHLSCYILDLPKHFGFQVCRSVKP